MPLLEAAVNDDPNPNKDSGFTPIVENGALLSDTGPAGSLADLSSSTPHSDQISVYIVRPGDTLSEIAAMFNVSINTILWSNDLKKGVALKTGQQLVILPVTGVQYQVKKGDTLAGIAKRFGGDPAEILSYNTLGSAADLAVGETIIIPDGELGTSATVKPGTKPGVKPKPDGGGPSYDGYYKWPVVGGKKTQGLHGHNGIDIGAPLGTPILAAAAGTVLIARDGGWNGGYGSYIVIKHSNGTQTLYGHASAVLVTVGQTVSQGEEIGEVGRTGQSTGMHLHFEVRGAKNPF